MDKSELLSLAREYAKNEDLFDLLGIDALKAEDPAEVRRAWRKASLKYHPDKVGGPSGDGFNDAMKAKWELLERAREILSDPATREAYNSARSAILVRQQQRAAMDAKKRAMVEELEARENGTFVGAKRKREDDGRVAETEEEKRTAMERGRKRREERQRQLREAEERERLRDIDNAPIIPEQQKQKKAPTTTGSAAQSQPDQSQGDDSDDRIADLERRLEEVRRKKAAKKARKDNKEPEAAPAPKRSAKMDALLARLQTGKQGE
ncbi:hypothetical protein PG999_003862 [Apiospora kogelbergensis]|uniref:J domain-containing protein n=1 Tax=Apiospora kogelbergensis TaxID=1337665 RepID=A0AAW0R4T8_9PEZI